MKNCFIVMFLLLGAPCILAMENKNYGSTSSLAKPNVNENIIPKKESDFHETEIILTTEQLNKKEKEFDLNSLEPKNQQNNGGGGSVLNSNSPLTPEQFWKAALLNRGFKQTKKNKKIKKSSGFSTKNPYRSTDFYIQPKLQAVPLKTSDLLEQYNNLTQTGMIDLLQQINNLFQDALNERTTELKEDIGSVQKKQQSTFRDWLHEGTGAIRSGVTVAVLGLGYWLMNRYILPK
ncbi:TPA: hypothetical protein DDZ86_01265 [Candidatus Dependentiae bacterium]|nr:hypothetical protein [Candidatus Dependentiae bacterium]